MSEIKGCMNCGNISCGNNKKRESAGCGRYISPEDIIKELEAKNAELKEKVEAYDRNRDRLIAMGFPHFRNWKEYAEKLKEIEKENAELKEKVNILDNCDRLGDVITEAYKDQITKAKEIIKKIDKIFYSGENAIKRLSEISDILAEAEQFLKELEKWQRK